MEGKKIRVHALTLAAFDAKRYSIHNDLVDIFFFIFLRISSMGYELISHGPSVYK